MVHSHLRTLAIAVFLVGVPCFEDLAAKDPVSDPKAIEGLWSGSWGGGGANGVVFQPVIAELMIKGGHVEMHAFPGVGRLRGTIRFDTRAKQIRITPTGEQGNQPAKAITYSYDIKGGELTLNDENKRSIHFDRHGEVRVPLANAMVEFVVATGINEAGDLLVTKFNVLRAGQAKEDFLDPWDERLETKQATILLMEETGLEKITVDEARRLIHQPTPVVVTYRHEERPERHQSHELWKDIGPPTPDSEAVSRTFSRLLRPGTMVFVLSPRDNILEPESPP